MKIPVEVSTLNTLLSILESLEDDDKVGETPEMLDLKDKVKQANSKWMVVKIEETQHWPLVSEGTKVYGVYLVDLNEVTYLCEMRPSHYLYHLYNVADTDSESEREEIESYSSGDDENIYRHTTALDALPAIFSHPCGPVEDHEIEDSYEDMVETYLEHYREHHVY